MMTTGRGQEMEMETTATQGTKTIEMDKQTSDGRDGRRAEEK